MIISTFRYDIEGLADKLDIEMEDMSNLFFHYLEEVESEISVVERLYAKKDWNMLQRTIHNIKGVSVNLEIYDIYKLAADFDSNLKNKEYDSADVFIKEIKRLFNGAEQEIKRFFSQRGYYL